MTMPDALAHEVAEGEHQGVGCESHRRAHAHLERVAEADEDALVEAPVGDGPGPRDGDQEADASRADDLLGGVDDVPRQQVVDGRGRHDARGSG